MPAVAHVGAVLIIVAAVTLGLPATATAAATSVGTVSCYDGDGSSNPADPSISYRYLHGASRTCSFTSQFDWIAAIRDATVRGLHGGDYSSIAVLGGGDDDTLVLASFSGAGATGTVQTGGFDDGPAGWRSESKTACHSRFAPTDRTAPEGLMIKDYMYHLEQVVRSNSRGYTGTTVVSAAKLVAASGNAAVYAPRCTDLS